MPVQFNRIGVKGHCADAAATLPWRLGMCWWPRCSSVNLPSFDGGLALVGAGNAIDLGLVEDHLSVYTVRMYFSMHKP
jgi:hypothetical protein